MADIPLRNRAGEIVGMALVDDADYPLLSRMKWYLTKQGYVGTGRSGLMHRLLMAPEAGKVVDHINGDRLDNRRSNLRVCFQFQNFMNSPKHKDNRSGYKGVCWSKGANSWVARISVMHVGSKYLGCFRTAEAAAAAYAKAAEELHGEFLHKSLKKEAV